MAGPPLRPHGHQRGQPAPRPFPSTAPDPRGQPAEVGVMGCGEVGLDSSPCQSRAGPCQTPPAG